MIFVGQVMTGGVVSTSVRLWLHVALLLHKSVACQVRVTICGQTPLVTVLSTLRVTFVPEHASRRTAGGSNVQALPHSTILFVDSQTSRTLTSSK